MAPSELTPDQIITLNDYPVYSQAVLVEYFNQCRRGETLPFVPVIKKNTVLPFFDDTLRRKFKRFEQNNPTAEYFMLDGSHRTTAATLTGRTITVVAYEKDADIIAAKNLLAVGQTRPDDTFDHTLEENCKILNQHFSQKPYFETVAQKTNRMILDNLLPLEMVDAYRQYTAG